MMRSLFTKTLYDKRWFCLGWSLALGGMILLVLSFYPTLSEGNVFDELSKTVPPQFKELIGDASAFHNISGYISQQLFDIRVSLLFMILALILGVSLSVGEEEKGVLRTVVAMPLSRLRIVLEKWLAAVVIMGIVSLVMVAGVYIGVIVLGEEVSSDLIWQLGLLAWLFGSSAVAISLGIGLATGNRAITMAISVLATIGSFIVSTFGKSVDWLEPLEKFSLMHYYDANKVADSGLPKDDMMVLLAVFLVMLAVACIGFRYRDVG